MITFLSQGSKTNKKIIRISKFIWKYSGWKPVHSRKWILFCGLYWQVYKPIYTSCQTINSSILNQLFHMIHKLYITNVYNSHYNFHFHCNVHYHFHHNFRYISTTIFTICNPCYTCNKGHMLEAFSGKKNFYQVKLLFK